MTPLHPPAADTPLHATAASRAIEARQLAAHAPGALMARAGLAVAKLALVLAPQGRSAWVLAGPGHNGGDGWVAARHLHACGWAVCVVTAADPARLPPDAAAARTAALAAGVPWQTEWPAGTPDLLIDALLGLGQTRAPEGAIAASVARINALPAPVLAVDVPTGLDDTRGVRLGTEAVRASATLTLLTAKPGLFTAEGRDHAGTVWHDALATADAAPPDAWLTGRSTALAARPLRQHRDHKGRFGDVWVIGGDAAMAGAGALAARAALQAGAGRVFVAGPAHPSLPPDVMTPAAGAWHVPGVAEAATVVAGCGGGGAVATVLPEALARAGRLVLDADALNAIAADAALAAQLSARQQPTVLTPHPLEAARLLSLTAAAVQADRLAAAQALAQRYGATVVLKGSGSVVAAPGAVPFINPTGNARLAVPGSGDVLAGWLAGLWAQQTDADAQRLAAGAVWWHGAAAAAGPADAPFSASALVAALGT
ncbi:MAG: NAD(P)H-hydrate dehydratase [Proteobacteria bacterium]|nr:NAD(P)H-hydrate dehydratase [Pseudomonadota bacterium]